MTLSTATYLFPALAVYDHRDGASGKAVLFGKLRMGELARCVLSSNHVRFLCIDLCPWSRLARKEWMRPMLDLVKSVFGLRSPGKVFKSVIRSLPVGVPAFHAFRAWTFEGFQDKAVNEYHSSFSIRRSQFDLPVSTYVLKLQDDSVTARQACDPSATTDFVAAFVSDNGLPGFGCHSGVCKPWR